MERTLFLVWDWTGVHGSAWECMGVPGSAWAGLSQLRHERRTLGTVRCLTHDCMYGTCVHDV